MGFLFGAGMPVLLGLAAAVTWGAADFCGGLAARRAAPSRVVLLAHGTSLVLLLAWSLRQPAHLAGWATVSGVLSGIAGGVALMLFYEALALGAMGLSAAVAGLLTAVLPVLLALRTQGAPGAPQLAGFAVAAASIVLIAYAPQPAPVLASSAGEASAAGSGDDTLRMVDDGSPDAAKSRRAASSRKPLVFAVLAGLGFGLQLVWLHTSASAGSSEAAGTHPLGPVLRALLLSRAGGAAAALAVFLLTRARGASGLPHGALPEESLSASLGTPPSVAPTALPEALPESPPWTAFAVLALLAGLLDTSGNGLYMLSSLGGRLDVAAVLSSLYPGATIVLAAIILRERATRLQALGMACALVAVALIAA